MFAVPEHTVLVARRPAVSATAVVRAVAARAITATVPAPVVVDDPRVTAEVVALAPGAVVDAGHDAGQGAFTVLRGAVIEESGGQARDLVPGQVRLFGPGYRHRVRNTSAEPAFALRVTIA